MALIDRRGEGAAAMTDLDYVDALLIGMAQSCALIPGVSRSGSTICMALAIGMARPDAARFSFLLGIPAIAGAGIFEMKEAFQSMGGAPFTPIVLATGDRRGVELLQHRVAHPLARQPLAGPVRDLPHP